MLKALANLKEWNDLSRQIQEKFQCFVLLNIYHNVPSSQFLKATSNF